ncbi:MAG: hypothetical protein ABJA67_00820 [Chthonomonadales bacterium]
MVKRIRLFCLSITLLFVVAGVSRGQVPLPPYPASERGVAILRSYKTNPSVLELAKQRYKAVHALELRYDTRLASAGLSGIKVLFPELRSNRFYVLLENSTLDGTEAQWRFMCYAMNKSKLHRKWSIEVTTFSDSSHLNNPSDSLTEYLRTRTCKPANTTPKSIWRELRAKAKYTIYNLDSIVEAFYIYSSNWQDHSKTRWDIWAAFDIEFDPFTRKKLTTVDTVEPNVVGLDKFFLRYGYPPSLEEVTAMTKTGK